MNMSPYYYIMVHRDALNSIFKVADPVVRKMMLQIMRRVDEVHWPIRPWVAREGGPLTTLPGAPPLRITK